MNTEIAEASRQRRRTKKRIVEEFVGNPQGNGIGQNTVFIKLRS